MNGLSRDAAFAAAWVALLVAAGVVALMLWVMP